MPSHMPTPSSSTRPDSRDRVPFTQKLAIGLGAMASIGRALEATPDYHERTRVAAYKAFFAHGTGILTAWLFALTQAKIFHSSLHGVRMVGIGMGVVVLLIGAIPVLLVREGYRKISVT